MAFQVVFFGTSEIAVPILKALAESREVEIKAVITQQDKKAGRKQILAPSPIKILALEKEIPVFQPEKIKNNKEFQALLEGLKPDFFIVISYGKILPEKILKIPRYGSYNIHPSLLPKFRGPSPIQEALVRGEKETGVSIIKMNEKMDSGDIILLRRIPIEEKDDYDTLEGKLASLASQLIIPAIKDIADGVLKPLPQNKKNTTYCKKIEKESGKIDYNFESAKEIEQKIRAYKRWPGVFTTWNGKKIKIIKAQAQESDLKKIKESAKKPGTIIFLDKNKIGIMTKKGILIPETIQLEGKKEISIEEFLRGYEKKLRENPVIG